MSGRHLVALVPALGGCSLLNTTDACEATPSEHSLNQHGDEIEHIGHPQAAALVEDGKLAVAYVSTASDLSASRVFLVLVEPDPVVPLTSCDGKNRELRVDDTEGLAHAATLAAVDLPNPGAAQGSIAVGWSVGEIGDETAEVRVRVLDAAGCPLGPSFPPAPADLTGPVTGLSLAWSQARGALLATFHDGRTVHAVWIEAVGPASGTQPLGTEDQAFSLAASALAPDGRGIVAWAQQDLADFANREIGVRAVLLDEDARPRPAELAGGAAEPFLVARTLLSRSTQVYLVAAAAADDRYAVLLEGTDDADAPGRVLLREVDARDGVPLRSESAPTGEASPTEPGDGAYQGAGSLLYLPDGGLLVLWESLTREGTAGRLLGPDGEWRFTGIACGERPFEVGARNRILPGPSSPLVVGDRVWVLHAGDAADDSRATGALGWSLALADLWPVR